MIHVMKGNIEKKIERPVPILKNPLDLWLSCYRNRRKDTGEYMTLDIRYTT